MITGPQIRQARRLLGWNVVALAGMAEIAPAIVERAERSSGMPSITLAQAARIQAVCEAAGVVFSPMGGVTLSIEQVIN